MRVWIDQDCCTGAGLCVDHCPDLFVVLEDGIGYVHAHGAVISEPGALSVVVPQRLERDAIDAVERCPGECIYLEPDAAARPSAEVADVVEAAAIDANIVDADIVDR